MNIYMVKKKGKDKVSEKLSRQQKDINELKKILKRLTTKFLKSEKKKLSVDDFETRKKSMMNKVNKTDNINELKKLIKSLIKKVGEPKDFEDIKKLLQDIKLKPESTKTTTQSPPVVVTGGGGSTSPPVIINNTFPQGGLGVGGLQDATKREPKIETKEEKQNRLRKRMDDKVQEARKKILAKKKEEEALKQGKKIRKMTPREAYLSYKPPYILDDDDFILEGLMEYNEQNEEDGMEELSPEEYVEMLESDNYGFPQDEIDSDGFIKEAWLREWNPDLFDTVGTPAEELEKEKERKLNAKTIKEDSKKFFKFNKSLAKAYKKGRKIGLKDIADLVEDIPYEESKFYFNAAIKPMYEYTKEPAINMFNALKEFMSNQTKRMIKVPDIKSKTLTDDIDTDEEDDEIERPEIRTATLGDDLDIDEDNDEDNDDDNDDNDTPDFGGGGGMGRPDDRRRRPPPKDEPKDDKEDEEEDVKVTTTTIPEDSGVEVPDIENVIVELPIGSTELTNDIYTNQIPSLAETIVMGGVGLGGLALGLSGRSLASLRNEIPFQIRRRPTREITEADYEIRDAPPNLDLDVGGFGRAIAQNTQVVQEARDRLTNEADTGAIRLGIRENIDRRTNRVRSQRERTEQNFRTTREEYNEMKRDALRALQTEKRARQDLGAIQAAAEKAIDVIKDRENKVDNRLDSLTGEEQASIPVDRLPFEERSTTLGSAINYRRAVGRRPAGYITQEIGGVRYYTPPEDTRQLPITQFVSPETTPPPRVEIESIEEAQDVPDSEEEEVSGSVLFPPK